MLKIFSKCFNFGLFKLKPVNCLTPFRKMAGNSRSITAVELDDGPFYFQIVDKSDVVKRVKHTYPHELLNHQNMYFITAFKQGKSWVENLKSDAALNAKIRTFVSQNPDITCYPTFSYKESNHLDFTRGVALCVRKADTELDVKIGQLNGAPLRFCIKDDTILQEVTSDGGVTEDSVVVPVAPPVCHPAFLHEENNSVFHSFERVIRVLEECKDSPEVSTSLRILSDHIDEDTTLSDLQSEMKHAFIVVEGLDATGKSTLVEKLGEHLGAVTMRTPPNYLRDIRGKFDCQPQLIRRAYYSLCNYCVVKEIAEQCKTRPVVMDRFWQSTAAYALAHESGCGNESTLPPRGHWIYSWPDDLLKPSIIIFLTVTEQVRSQRLSSRNEAMNDEEKKISASQLFRRRLLEAYRRMDNPSMVEVDACGTQEEVMEMVLKELKQLGVLD